MHHEEEPAPESLSTTSESRETEATQRARLIARDFELVDRTMNSQELRFSHIVESLKQSNLLDSEIERVKRIFLEELDDFGQELKPDVWEMLTVMELFDPETARHCVDTYHIARHKVEDRLFNGMVLINSFKDEGVSPDAFFTSCLLHDIGKVEVPYAVVGNNVSDEECSQLLFENIETVLVPSLQKHLNNPSYKLPDTIDSGHSLLAYLYDELHIRPKEITPMRLLLGEMPPEKETEITEQLSHCGCTLDDTLLHIMHTHDQYSRRILTEAGRPIEAVLAGAHHVNKGRTYTITVGTIQVSVDLADIIHLADTEQAMTSARHYKSEHTPLQALKILALHAKQGAVDAYISYLWIADTLIKKGRETRLDSSEQETYAFIADFLDKMKREHLDYPAWRTVAC
jgi:HD-GYP domain-containing protein (c-di-GMP phosphodiesterase class II)